MFSLNWTFTPHDISSFNYLADKNMILIYTVKFDVFLKLNQNISQISVQ